MALVYMCALKPLRGPVFSSIVCQQFPVQRADHVWLSKANPHTHTFVIPSCWEDVHAISYTLIIPKRRACTAPRIFA